MVCDDAELEQRIRRDLRESDGAPPPLPPPIEDPTPVVSNMRKRKTVVTFPPRLKGKNTGGDDSLDPSANSSSRVTLNACDERDDIEDEGTSKRISDETDADMSVEDEGTHNDEHGDPTCPECSITLMVATRRGPCANDDDASDRDEEKRAANGSTAAFSASRVEEAGEKGGRGSKGVAAVFMSPGNFSAAVGKYKNHHEAGDASSVPQSPPTAADIVGVMDVPPYCFSCRSYIIFESVEAKKREDMLLNLYDLMAQSDEADDGQFHLPRGKVVVVPASSKGRGKMAPKKAAAVEKTTENGKSAAPQPKSHTSSVSFKPEGRKTSCAQDSFTHTARKSLLDDDLYSTPSSNSSVEVALEDIGAKIDQAVADARASRLRVASASSSSSSSSSRNDTEGFSTSSSTSSRDPFRGLELEPEGALPSPESSEGLVTAPTRSTSGSIKPGDDTRENSSSIKPADGGASGNDAKGDVSLPDDRGSATKKRRLSEVSTGAGEESKISPLWKRLRDSEARANGTELLLAHSKQEVACLEERSLQAEEEKREAKEKMSMALMEKIMAEGQLARAMVGQVAGGDEAVDHKRAAIEQLQEEHEERVKQLKAEAMEDRAKLVGMGKKMLSDVRAEGERKVQETTEAYEARIAELVQLINSFDEKRQEYEEKANAKIASIKHTLHCSTGKENEISKQYQSLEGKWAKVQSAMKRLRAENERLLCRVPPEQAEAERKVREMEDKYDRKVDEIAATVKECREKQGEYETKSRATIASYKHQLHVSTGKLNEVSSENITLREQLAALENEKNLVTRDNDTGSHFRAPHLQRQFDLLQKEFRFLLEDNRRLKELEAAHIGDDTKDYIKIDETKSEPERNDDITKKNSSKPSSATVTSVNQADSEGAANTASECRALVAMNNPATLSSPRFPEEGRALVLSPRNGVNGNDDLLHLYSVPSFESSPGTKSEQEQNLLQSRLNTDVHRQFDMLQQVMEGLLDENRSLKGKPGQSPVLSRGPVSLLDNNAQQERSTSNYSRPNDLQCATIQALKKENIALESRADVAIADTHRSEQRAWDLEEELARARSEMALMNLALRRAEMQMGGFFGGSDTRITTDDASGAGATPPKSESFRSPRRMRPNSAKGAYAGRKDDKENRSRRKLSVSSPKPGRVLTPSNRSRSVPVDSMIKSPARNSSTKTKSLLSPASVEYTTVRMTWKSPL